MISRTDLGLALPINLLHRHRRAWYLVRVECEVVGRVVSINAWSLTWHPMFEQIRRPDYFTAPAAFCAS